MTLQCAPPSAAANSPGVAGPHCAQNVLRRALPAGVLACALVISGCGLLWHRDLPRQLAGFKQTLVLRDAGGIAEVQRLTERNIPVRSGAFAMYGGSAVSVWTARATDSTAAQQWIAGVAARIAVGDTPFHADLMRTIDAREVRIFRGLGQRHFCFRSGTRVVWLAANAGPSELALGETLRFYR